MRSKVHTALTAPLVYIVQGFTNALFFMANCGMNFFLIVIYHSSLVKGAMNAARVCKLRNGGKNA
jgi:hypothetical protein